MPRPTGMPPWQQIIGSKRRPCKAFYFTRSAIDGAALCIIAECFDGPNSFCCVFLAMPCAEEQEELEQLARDLHGLHSPGELCTLLRALQSCLSECWDNASEADHVHLLR